MGIWFFMYLLNTMDVILVFRILLRVFSLKGFLKGKNKGIYRIC